jgi:ribosomal protein S18 acetylase RimI-like enzyme
MYMNISFQEVGWSKEDIEAFISIQLSVANSITYRMGYLSYEKASLRLLHVSVFFVKNDGIIVGSVEWEQIDHERVHIKSIAIKPEYQDQGIGHAVLRTLIKDILCEYMIVTLQTHTLNRALNLYKRLGFTIDDTTLAPDSNDMYHHLSLKK